MSILGSISYELPLNSKGSFLVAPEISYYFPINETVQNTNWKISSIRAGIALKYAIIPELPKEEIFKREIYIDTIQVESDIIAENKIIIGKENKQSYRQEKEREIIITETITRKDTLIIKKIYKLSGKITAVGVDNFGQEIPRPKFVVEEFVSNRLDPLLNYIFFDDNSSELPARYKKLNSNEIKDFEIEKLFYDSTLQIYYNILNIVGKRMLANPTAKITLIGCNSDQGAEKGNIELSRKRAEEVKSYLTTVWNIADDRITIQTRNLPQKASTPTNEPDKIAENRRVEIISDNEKITEPIFIEKIDRTTNPPIVRFKLEADAEAGLKNWDVKAYQNFDKENRFEYSKLGQIESQLIGS